MQSLYWPAVLSVHGTLQAVYTAAMGIHQGGTQHENEYIEYMMTKVMLADTAVSQELLTAPQSKLGFGSWKHTTCSHDTVTRYVRLWALNLKKVCDMFPTATAHV